MAETTFGVGGRNVGYEEAIDWQDDFLQEKQKHDQSIAFLRQLHARAASLEKLVAFYLELDPRRIECSVSSALQGGFNVALAVRIHDELQSEETRRDQRGWPQNGHNVVLRLPMPASCGEAVHPGSVLEKMRCEVAMYVWMQQHCPDIRIPFLYGFGFPDGRHVGSLLYYTIFNFFPLTFIVLTPKFAHASRVSFVRKAWLYIRQTFAAVCSRPVPSDYLAVTLPVSIELPPDTGYMLLEFLGPSMGTRLDLVADPRNRPLGEIDAPRKRNLYRSFSRVMLSLARIPQPRIGAFRLRDDGTIALDNRPLVSTMTILESEGAPRTIHRDQTFNRVDDYIESMIDFHEQRFLAAPHAAVSKFDGQLQMATWVFLRSLLRHFVNRERNTGPFVLQLTDKNHCNFLVDEDWNVTAMYDLEFIISAPVESMDTPKWLSWASLDEIAYTMQSAMSLCVSTERKSCTSSEQTPPLVLG